MANPKESAAGLVRDLRGLLGDHLKSALLYGSVARGEAVPGVSDINVLALFDRIDAAVLEKASPLARRWAKAGNSLPLFMTWDEWRSAADSFAIELADMRDAHDVLYGDDPLAGLVVERSALRLQAERELRGKLVQLREGLLLTAEKPAEVGRLLLTALPSFTTYLRAALRLAGREAPVGSEAAIRDAGQLLGAEPEPFLRVWRARVGKDPLRAAIGDPLVTAYYALAQRTAEYVDTLAEGGAQ